MKTPLNYGDIVFVRIKGTSLVNRTSNEFDGELSFKIIGYSFVDQHYILLVPKYYNIKNTWPIKESDLIDFNIQNVYKNRLAIAAKLEKIIRVECKKSNQDGTFCSTCGKFCYMAAPNQINGDFICYSCRNNPFKSFK